MRRPVLIFLLIASLCAGCSLERRSANRGITLEVAVFEGGYGITWHKQIARQYEKLHPGITINLWGDPRVDEKLKPRVLRNNPPDLANCSLPVWKLILANKLLPLDDALTSPAYGQPDKKWRDTLTPGVLSAFQYQNKTYAMPSNLSIWTCWYDKRMFRKQGWQAPKTWDEFMALCDKIKAAGIAPLAFQGKYPTYAWPVLLALYQRMVPFDVWYEMQDIKPGAFLRPEFIQAARMMQEMATKYYQKGAMSMTHTESQMEWVNGRAAMVFCGLWLKNEMKEAIPPGFEMACFPIPTVPGGKGDATAAYGGGGENFFVFTEAKHPKEALDFLKYMMSKEAAQAYALQLSTLSPVRDSVKGITIPSDLQSAVDVVDHSSRFYSDMLGSLYLEFQNSVLRDALADLLSGSLPPEQFAARLEAGIDKARRNPEIYKPPARGVPAL